MNKTQTKDKKKTSFDVNNRAITPNDADKIKQILKQQSNDYHLLLDFVWYCNENHIKQNHVERIIKDIVDIECYRDYYQNKIRQIYTNTSPLEYLGIDGLNDVLTPIHHETIVKIIKQPKDTDLLIDQIASDKQIIIDRVKHTVMLKHQKVLLRGDDRIDQGRSDLIINASPIKVTIVDSPITEAPRDFNIQWKTSLSSKPFTTSGEKGAANINEIANYLENAGYSPHPNKLKGAVASVINCYQREGLAIIKEEVENPGFFYNNEEDKVIVVKYDYITPKKAQLKEAIQLLHNLGDYFKGVETKLASSLKWSWMSAFSYILKQYGNWMPWLYLHGQAGSGKTTLGKICLYCWGTPNEKNETGGSSFDSEYKVGMILSQSTFPHLINEPLGLFQKRGVFEMLKTSIEHTIARSKNINGVYTQIPAFTPIIFTANQSAPQDDAFLRRTYRIPFYYNERKDDKSKKSFKEKFFVENPKKSPLTLLQHISNYFLEKIAVDPSILEEDWMTVADKLLHMIEEETETTLPSWIYTWQETENLEDYDDDQREMLRMFFMERINDANRKVTVVDTNGIATTDLSFYSDDDAVLNDDYRQRTLNVIGSNLIPWMFIKKMKGNYYVCVTKGIKKDLYGVTQTCSELKSMALLLDWDYVAVRKTGSDKPEKMARCLFDSFIDWVFMKDYDVEEDDL